MMRTCCLCLVSTSSATFQSCFFTNGSFHSNDIPRLERVARADISSMTASLRLDEELNVNAAEYQTKLGALLAHSLGG